MMTSGRRPTRRAILSLGASAVLAACGRGSEPAGGAAAGPTTLQFWTNGDEALGYAKEYEQRTSGVRFEGLKVGDYTVIAEKALANVAAGTPPQVSILGQRNGITQLADGGALVDIDGLLTRQERADFYPQYLEKFTYKSKLRTLPFQSSVPVLFYNKTLLQMAGLDPERPSTTWDEQVAAAQKLTKRVGAEEPSQWGYILSSYAWYLYALTWQNGGEVVDKQGQPRFQEEPGVAAAQWWKDLVHKFRTTPSTRPNANRTFSSGGAAMLQSSQTSQATFEKTEGLRFGIAFLPKRQRYAVSIGGNAIGIFKSTGNDTRSEKASWQFVNWATGTEMGARIVEETGYLPLRRSTMQTDRLKTYFKAHPTAEVPIQQLQYLQAHPIQRADELMWNELEKALTTMEKDPSANPRTLLDGVAAQVRQLLSR